MIGVPTVDAIEIPPWFAVTSVETSSPFDAVVTPRVISLSEIFNCCAYTSVVVPPIDTFPETF